MHETSGLGEGFLYVTFDIIKERIIEVKEFGACAVGSRQPRDKLAAAARGTGGTGKAGSRRQGAAGSKINSNKEQICKISLLVNWTKNE
jgi:hypothetical protein